ncbi:four helix bundle protein [Chryseobacterium sp. JK1]|uniref:four helix bundle protein n=1 Tax=Chryseobacterium sp. JK1 TaxID=874294 RepID=UPI003D683DB0
MLKDIPEDPPAITLQFLKIARGSCELETRLIISKNLNYLNSEKFEILIEKTSEISKMLNAVITKLQTS